MRPSPIILGALLGLAHSVFSREGLAAADLNPSNSVDGKAAPPTSSAPSLPTSPPDNNSSSDSGGDGSSSSSSSSSTSSSSSSSISSPNGGNDVTVTVTDTVTNTGAGSTVTKDVTTTTTSTKFVVATSTVFVTVTATGSGETATKVFYSTTTIFVNMKRRALPEDQLPARTTPAQVEAIPTDLPQADGHVRRGIQKRATVTVTKWVTVQSGGGTSTVTDNFTKVIVTPVSSMTTVTDTITETVAPNAKTTISITSVLTVTSTIVNTAVIESTDAPGNPSGGANSDGSSSGSSSSSSSSKGISTGAKVGIGIGAGVGGLAILGFVLFLVMRRRDRGPSPDPDDLVGASEVPIGPSGRNAPTSGNSAAAASLLGVSRPAAKPVSAEGYRGTAMGDGRAGFAKPDTFAPSYNVTPVSTTTSPVYNMTHAPEVGAGTAELGTDSGAATKWHDPSATEIDSQPVMSHRSGPVYEMPVQNYR